MGLVEGLDDGEDHQGDDQEVDDRAHEGAQAQHDGLGTAVGGLIGSPQGDVQRVGVGGVEQEGQQRRDDVADQGGRDLAEGRGDDNADGHVKDVPAGDEVFEFLRRSFSLELPPNKSLFIWTRSARGAAHVGPQDLRDGDAAVGLEVVLQEGDEHPGRRHHGVVQGVGQVQLAVRALDADLQPAGLGVAQVGAGADLKVFLLPGGPGLDVAGLDLQIRQVAGAALQLPHRDLQAPEQLHAVAPHLLVPVHALLGPADHDHLLLLELVDAVNAPLLDAVGALFLAEAGGIAGQVWGRSPSGMIWSMKRPIMECSLVPMR